MSGEINLAADTSGIDARLEHASKPLDLRPAWMKLEVLWRAREAAQFEQSPWRPLSKRYAAEKEKEAPGQGILRRSGAMYEALLEPRVAELHPEFAEIGVRTGIGRSDLFYALFHQRGRGVPKRTIVKRFSADEREQWSDVIRDEALRQVLA
jgi:hypothetical protein